MMQSFAAEGKSLLDPDLLPIPSVKWDAEMTTLLEDEWLRRKTDRSRRLREHKVYILDFLPELLDMEPGVVVDVGPGPGEFLELARMLGHSIHGIDARTGKGGMGESYLHYSKLMTRRQRIPVSYIDARFWVRQEDPNFMANCAVINFRGSIEQVMSHLMEGEPHHVHHNCNMLSWKENGRTKDEFECFMRRCYRLLRPGGFLLIHANGAGNSEWYRREIECAASKANLRLDLTDPPRLHRWRR